MPVGLNDRAADAWEICVAIADVAGGDWPRFVHEAALKLSADGVVEDESIGTMLLADIRAAFIERRTDRLTSAALVEYLVALEDRPWAEFGRTQNAITKNRVAALLKPHKISPETIRIGLSSKDTAKGYYRRQFEDAFERHLPPFSSENVTPSQPEDSCDIPANSNTSQAEECDTFEMPRNPNNSVRCDGVTDREALSTEDTKEWRF
jgi:hypothetical protein